MKKKASGARVSPEAEGGGDLLSRFRSTIGAAGFNFSVRNGKRWSPRAVAALVSSGRRPGLWPDDGARDGAGKRRMESNSRGVPCSGDYRHARSDRCGVAFRRFFFFCLFVFCFCLGIPCPGPDCGRGRRMPVRKGTGY